MGRHDRSRTRENGEREDGCRRGRRIKDDKEDRGEWRGEESGGRVRKEGEGRVPQQHEPVRSEVLKSRAKILLGEKLFSDIGFALAARVLRVLRQRISNKSGRERERREGGTVLSV